MRYKNFITELIIGYNREVIYHNDLHAADVFQTVYVMIFHGKLMDVLFILIIETIFE